MDNIFHSQTSVCYSIEPSPHHISPSTRLCIPIIQEIPYPTWKESHNPPLSNPPPPKSAFPRTYSPLPNPPPLSIDTSLPVKSSTPDPNPIRSGPVRSGREKRPGTTLSAKGEGFVTMYGARPDSFPEGPTSQHSHGCRNPAPSSLPHSGQIKYRGIDEFVAGYVCCETYRSTSVIAFLFWRRHWGQEIMYI